MDTLIKNISTEIQGNTFENGTKKSFVHKFCQVKFFPELCIKKQEKWYQKKQKKLTKKTNVMKTTKVKNNENKKTMKTLNYIIILLLAIFLNGGNAFAQQQVVQGQRIPSLTTVQRDQIQVDGNERASGLMIFNADSSWVEYWDGDKWIHAGVKAANGLSKDKKTVKLGGSLNQETTIKLDGQNLNFHRSVNGGKIGMGTNQPKAPFDVCMIPFENEDPMMLRYLKWTDAGTTVADEENPTFYDMKISFEGVIRRARAWFYMPSIVIDLTKSGTFTRDLYLEYKKQATDTDNASTPANSPIPGTEMVSSKDAPKLFADVYNADQYYYYVTGYDANVFSNISITENGVMTYTVNASNVTDATYINIVFAVK